jgi:hypothetical protein
MGVTAQAIPFVPGDYNGLFFTNDEVWIDRDNDQQGVNGGNTVTAGDVFWGTLKLNQISGPTNNIGQGGPQIWGPGANPDEITGYFAAEVAAVVNVPVFGPRIIFKPLAAVADPNGIISAAEIADGVVIKIYEDNSGGFGNYNATTQGSAVTTATDGSLLWTLSMYDNATAPSGIAINKSANAGYWFSNANPDPASLINTNVLGDSFAGVNVVANNSSISKFGLVTDPNVSPTVFNHFWFNAELIVNSAALINGFTLGRDQPMHFFSNDPGVYFPIPEPGTLALFGLGLAGAFGVVRRRRRRT